MTYSNIIPLCCCGGLFALHNAPKRLLCGYEEEVETLHSALVRYDCVVISRDGVGERGVRLVESATVESVEQVVRHLQESSWQTVLEVENVETGDLSYTLAILLVVLHNLLITNDSECLYLREMALQDIAQFVGVILSYVPRVAGQRHWCVGCRYDKMTSRAQYTSHLSYKVEIIFDMLDNLERYHIVEGAVLEFQGWHLHSVVLGILELIYLLGELLVDGYKAGGTGC